MKNLTLIIRILLGTVFITFALNHWFKFLPNPPLSPAAVAFVTGDALADTEPLLAAFGLRLTPLREGLCSYLKP